MYSREMINDNVGKSTSVQKCTKAYASSTLNALPRICYNITVSKAKLKIKTSFITHLNT